MTVELLSTEWTTDEVAQQGSHIDASVPEAVNCDRERTGAAGGADHRPGHQAAAEPASGDAPRPLREPRPTPGSGY